MQLFLDTNLSSFAKATAPLLETDNRIHSMIMGLISRYLEFEKPMALLVRVVNSQGTLVATGIQTESDRTLILSHASVEVAEAFATKLASKIESLPGVNGPEPTVDIFAAKWAQLKNRQAKLITNLRLFELKELICPIQPSGGPRFAQPQDRETIFKWLLEFHAEAVPHDPTPKPEELYKGIDKAIALGKYFIWEDQGQAVSFVASARETQTQRWIAPVYTPPTLRGRGYAGALTAFVSQKILESGKYGMLFTDQANPISNSIYQKIGYKPVADFKHIGFE